MAKLKLDWSLRYEYTGSNVNVHAPTSGGVYRLIYKSDDKYYVFYVGQAGDIDERLRQHLAVTEPDACIKRHIRDYTCYFRYAKIESIADRNGAERALYDKYEPTCNDVAPPGPPADINFD